MKKNALLTLSACALASYAVLKIKKGLNQLKSSDTHLKRGGDQTAGMFV